MKNETMMKEAPLWKLMLKMGLPCVVIMLVHVLYSMADTFFIGQIGDPVLVAAVSLASPAYTIFSCLSTLFGGGACTAIALALGKGERKKARHYSAFAVWAGVATGLVLMAAMLIFQAPLLRFLGANEETAEPAAQYLNIVLLGSVAAMFTGVAGNAVRADGSTAKAMGITMAGTLLNIALDPLFISVFHWGVQGAAIATVLGNVVSGILLLLHCRKSDFLSLSIRDFTLNPSVSLYVLSLGTPMAASTVLSCFASVFANQLLVQHGTIAVAAQNVAGKAGMLIGMVVMGICMGIQPVISYLYGAGCRERLRRLMAVTVMTGVLVSGILCGACLVCREGFMRAFINDAEVIELGKLMLLPLFITPICGVYQACTSYLQSIGRSGAATVVSLLRQGLLYVPLLFLTNALWGLTGLVFASALADVGATAVAVAICLFKRKA